jgi:hypothetical protein
LREGAVNVRTGRFAYLDSEEIAIRPEHVMASGALAPALPPIEIDGEYYWDGGCALIRQCNPAGHEICLRAPSGAEVPQPSRCPQLHRSRVSISDHRASKGQNARVEAPKTEK